MAITDRKMNGNQSIWGELGTSKEFLGSFQMRTFKKNGGRRKKNVK